MLKQRIFTAILLLAVLLPALFYPSPLPFNALALLFIVAAGWEWGRLNGCPSGLSWLAGVGLGAGLAWLWWWGALDRTPPAVWYAAAGVWLLLALGLLRRGVAGWATVPQGLRLGLGWGLLGVAWWALASLRSLGTEMLLSVLLLVWVADIAAYFGGKAFGRRKLAPQISPGKSWAGVYSGWVGVCLLALAWLGWQGGVSAHGTHLYAKLWAWGPGWALGGLTLLAGMSVCGDLIESLVKRSAGMKDSSGLLPGHGGVLDRIDALLPVLPIAMVWAGA